MLRFREISHMFAILGLIALCPNATSAQATDPLVGTWNFRVTVTSGCTSDCMYIGMLAFNQGGTVVEQRGTVVQYPGFGDFERYALGTWRITTASLPYVFRMKNFVFDSNGKLSGYVIAMSGIGLDATRNTFRGSGTAKIFHANGTSLGTESFTISGTRF
jgi:hypothetical protein